MLIEVRDLTVVYDGINVLEGVTIGLDKGEIVSIIGANGAGKSTLLRTVAGVLRPRSGEILFKGRNIVRERPDRIVRFGICLVPEGRHIFPNLTVRENLEVGGHAVSGRALKARLFDVVMGTFPRLKERLGQHGGTLSGGEQQMLALGRALMGNPVLLLLDEPSMGLSPLFTKEIFSLVKRINEEEGISILLVEQNANMAMEYADRTYVLETGRVIMEGPSCDVKNSPAVVEAYLGLDLVE